MVWAERFQPRFQRSRFSDMSVLFGPPPKVIWVRLGNCSAQDIKTLLANSAEAIKEFLRHPDAGLLVLPNKVLL